MADNLDTRCTDAQAGILGPSDLESSMSRLNAPSVVQVRPTNNVYTGLALISMLAMLGAMGYVLAVFFRG
jgi:hypothetical protein